MKPKTGLHKKVACIFDGTPAGAQPAAGQFQPPASAFGPKPLPVSSSSQAASSRTASKGPAKQNKSIFGLTNKQGKTDPKQLKMLIMVGVLSVVLVGVLYFVLSTSPTPPKKAAAAVSPQPVHATDAAAAATAEGTLPWTKPEPWPEQIRDPMTMGGQGRTGENTPAETVVKGIVFSQTRPTAIVGEHIVAVGDTINGMTVTAIEKDAVEFEQDGKRWKQQVQR